MNSKGYWRSRGDQCSDLFAGVFTSGHGSCLMECSCGKIHFDGYNTSYSWEKGELEALKENAKNNPGKYVNCDYGITSMNVFGEEIVEGCSCNRASKIEDHIIRYASKIAEYLNSYANQLRERANEIQVTTPAAVKLAELQVLTNRLIKDGA